MQTFSIVAPGIFLSTLFIIAGCDPEDAHTDVNEGQILNASTHKSSDGLALTLPPQNTFDIDPDLEGVTSEDTPPWTREEIDNGEAPKAVVLASINLAGGVTVKYLGFGGEEIGVAVGGPETSSDAIADALATTVQAESPLESYLSLAPKNADVPLELMFYSERVVERGDWQPMVRSQGKNTHGLSPNTSLTNAAHPSMSTCGVDADGEGSLHGDWGNCTDYSRSTGATTSWSLTDILAFAGNVTALTGNVDWVVQKRNCNTCTWWVAFDQAINQGNTYYFYSVTPTNDYNVSSVVTQTNTGTHNHDVGRCHDWGRRTDPFTSTAAGGCELRYSTTTLFCNDTLDYLGADPSNIYTNNLDWDGSGQSYNCP